VNPSGEPVSCGKLAPGSSTRPPSSGKSAVDDAAVVAVVTEKESAMRAHAIVLLGCAWVVWQVAVDVNTTSLTYSLGQAEETKSTCEAAARVLQASLARDVGQHPYRDGNPVALPGRGAPTRLLTHFRCFPDTVDPRGK
jgi:hypothetical protein